MFALFMEPYAMIQVSILLQPHRIVTGNFVCFAEPWLTHTAITQRDLPFMEKQASKCFQQQSSKRTATKQRFLPLLLEL